MTERNFAVQGSIDINGVNVDLTNTQLGSSIHRIGNTATAKRETPIGTVVMYTGLINGSKTNLPNGWLLCDGSEISVSSYPDLDAVVGTRYGSRTNGSGGAGTSHFRVPNLVDKIPVGHIQTNTDAPNTISSASDSTTLNAHTHTSSHNSNAVDDFSSHGHVVTAGNSTHNHGTSTANKSGNGHNLGAGGEHTHQYKYGNSGGTSTTSSDSNHTHNSSTVNIPHAHNAANASSVTHDAAHNSNPTSLDHSHTVTVSTSDANQTMNNTSHQHSGGLSTIKVFFMIKAQHGVH
jgi:microcystin-dependent protein